MKNKIKIAAIVLSMFIFIVVLCFSQNIKIEKKDDVTIIHNPKKPGQVPGAPKALSLEEDLRIGIDEGDEDYMFANLRSVQVDDEENIYVLDAKYIKVKVYDKNGKHIRSFGKNGQGPGEFGWPSRMVMRADGKIAILDSRNRRFSYYSREGECLKEVNHAEYGNFIRAWPDSRGFVYCDVMSYSENSRLAKLVKFDAEFNKISELAEMEEKRNLREINPILYRIVYNVLPDDRVIWARNLEYCIHVVDASGKLVKKIYKDYDPVTIPEAEKERIKEEYSSEGFPPTLKIVFPKKYPPIYYLLGGDKGRIYVRTYTKNDEDLSKWDVFDEEGRYILSFFHPEEDILFAIKNGKSYSINQDNEEGIPHVRRYKMVWQR
jgi:hypothetical protein